MSGLTWSQDGKYGQCCPTTLTSCYAPTACFSGSLVYPYPDISSTRTIGCAENFGNASYSICNTAYVYENMQDSSPQTDIVCGEEAVNWSYYRAVPASITEAGSRAGTYHPSPNRLLTDTHTAFSIPVPSSSANGSDTKSKGTSKAWIAGAVVGPLLGLALIGAILFFLLRRRKNHKNAPRQGGAVMAPTNPTHPPPGVGGFTDAKPQFVPQYANQGQQGYGDAPISPVPQYHPTNSPPPQDVKHGYMATPVGGTNQAVAMHQTAELGGDSLHGGPGPSELASGGGR